MSTLRLLPGRFTVCRLPADAPVPDWAGGTFTSVTRTPAELSLVCAAECVPDGVTCDPGWCAFEVAGPLDFTLTGILSAIAAPLAAAGISIFAIATFDTDYVLIGEVNLARAVEELRIAGHRVDIEPN